MTKTTRQIEVGLDVAGNPICVAFQDVKSGSDGPTLLVTAAIHGDEIVGIEIIRQLRELLDHTFISGSVVLVPAANILGMMCENRALPGQKDVNRRIALSDGESYLDNVARVLCSALSNGCDIAIDLHSARQHAEYLPHIRTNAADLDALRMASAFGCSVVVDVPAPPGSVRSFANGRGIPAVTYEAGEALRFGRVAVDAGVRGILNVMAEFRMLRETILADRIQRMTSGLTWVQAPQSGLLLAENMLGVDITEGEKLGSIVNYLGDEVATVRTAVSGVVIGQATLPLVYSGDDVFLVAQANPSNGP